NAFVVRVLFQPRRRYKRRRFRVRFHHSHYYKENVGKESARSPTSERDGEARRGEARRGRGRRGGGKADKPAGGTRERRRMGDRCGGATLCTRRGAHRAYNSSIIIF